jgi:hypothetical protein
MPPKPLVAMVALREELLPSEGDLFHFIRDTWPDSPSVGGIRRKENVLSFDVGDHAAAVSSMPAPIPWADLEGPCREAWYWPQAADAFRNHAAHTLVVLVPKSGDRIEAATSLTRVVAAVAACSEAVGILWGGGGLVHAPQQFVTAAGKMSRESLPLDLWISFGIAPEEDGTHSLYTSGLEAFGHMEIEVANSRRDPQFLIERVFNVAHFLLDKGPILHEGETIGMTDEERIEVRHGPSMCDGETTVIQLDW